MAQRQSAHQHGVLGDINDWIARHNAQAGLFARVAEAKGRQIWEDSIRTGENVLARTQSELRALGASQPDHKASAFTAPKPTNLPAPYAWVDRSGAAKSLFGLAAERAAQPVGIARGAWHSLQGIGKALDFADRLWDPDDAEINGPDRAAWGQVYNAGKAATDYVRKGIANPASVAQDIGNATHQFHVGIDPNATPAANTFVGELNRRKGIGLNQGELGWDVASLVAGSPALKTAEGLGAVGDTTSAAEFMSMGFTPAQAERLALPYTGAGHHSPLPRAVADDLGVPAWLRDSRFNVVKPSGMNQGDFYKFHFENDPQYYGSGFSSKIGGGWSGQKLGFQKNGLLGRLWYGTPPALAAVPATAGTAGLLNYQPSQDPSQ